MKRKGLKISALFLAGMLTSGFVSMDVLAAEDMTVIEEEAGIRTGTLGDYDGFQWTYDEATKTLTVTGEDSGFVGIENPEEPAMGSVLHQYFSPFHNIDSDVERIVLQDCTIKGSAKAAFCSLRRLKTIEFNNVDTSEVTDMNSMFAGCSQLTDMDISGLDTSNVTDMSRMFYWCTNVEELDVSNFKTSNVTDMNEMFYSCSSVKDLELSNFDTSNVTDMSEMFTYCSGLESLDISAFDTSNVTHMDGMFGYCSGLESLAVSALDTSDVTSLFGMFMYCNTLKSIDLSTFDTSNVTSMSYMFYECNSLETVDLSVLDTSKVEEAKRMFEHCDNLQSLDMSGCDFSCLEDTSMFVRKCDKLISVLAPAKLSASIYFDAIFCDSEGNRITELTDAYCNKTLNRKPLDVLVESAELTIGNSQPVSLYVFGVEESVQPGSYVWTVDSQDVLTVDDTGVVTAVGMGTATITCTSSEDESVSATCEMTVRIPFSDIKVTDWQYPYVVYAYENNLMSGKGEGNFDMSGKITRSEFVTVLYSHSEKPEVTFSDEFSDVTSDDWFANAVTWAKQEGISAGNADGTFGAYNNITREQLVAMLYQYAIKNEVAEEGVVTADLTSYADLDKVSTWAVDALTWAVENDIIGGKVRNGMSYLDPKESTTRGECATMMMRYVELTK